MYEFIALHSSPWLRLNFSSWDEIDNKSWGDIAQVKTRRKEIHHNCKCPPSRKATRELCSNSNCGITPGDHFDVSPAIIRGKTRKVPVIRANHFPVTPREMASTDLRYNLSPLSQLVQLRWENIDRGTCKEETSFLTLLLSFHQWWDHFGIN